MPFVHYFSLYTMIYHYIYLNVVITDLVKSITMYLIKKVTVKLQWFYCIEINSSSVSRLDDLIGVAGLVTP